MEALLIIPVSLLPCVLAFTSTTTTTTDSTNKPTFFRTLPLRSSWHPHSRIRHTRTRRAASVKRAAAEQRGSRGREVSSSSSFYWPDWTVPSYLVYESDDQLSALVRDTYARALRDPDTMERPSWWPDVLPFPGDDDDDGWFIPVPWPQNPQPVPIPIPIPQRPNDDPWGDPYGTPPWRQQKQQKYDLDDDPSAVDKLLVEAANNHKKVSAVIPSDPPGPLRPPFAEPTTRAQTQTAEQQQTNTKGHKDRRPEERPKGSAKAGGSVQQRSPRYFSTRPWEEFPPLFDLHMGVQKLPRAYVEPASDSGSSSSGESGGRVAQPEQQKQQQQQRRSE
ncbi:unnamed protein product [Vitrella brassicaformis CCMP3155]|uniref:Uncharacterized protein n=2 Tax=Vitrella brassicaformis TaxID=1169539 RepID=A0A0G4ETT5_VITBC|nr:unnamed protein product [Vitrella brassicaformis CCMP3155]|mmetsp:Transcript_35034/g.86993  ORF Transcript_35034/g.86993 Transcript_35034/m.86993 type:complete len:334 (+) Transcript_35034:102-1103(+)|eukprot:CEM01669.1 unnamed protein product [Vitrella brassicaformis CCMP3155]